MKSARFYPPKHLRRRGFIHIIVVAVLALSIGMAAMYGFQKIQEKRAEVKPSPTPETRALDLKEEDSSSETLAVDETAGWKTYTSSEGGYSINYPADYQLLVNEKFSVDGVRIPLENTLVLISDAIPEIGTNYQISITHFNNIENNLNDFVSKNISCLNINTEEGEKFNLDGEEALLLKDVPCGPFPNSQIFSIKDGVGYEITIETTVPYDEIKKFVDQILSTFQFTD